MKKAYVEPNHFPVFRWNHCLDRSHWCPAPTPLPLPHQCTRLDFHLSVPLSEVSSHCWSLLCCQHGRLQAAESSPPRPKSLIPLPLAPRWDNSGVLNQLPVPRRIKLRLITVTSGLKTCPLKCCLPFPVSLPHSLHLPN